MKDNLKKYAAALIIVSLIASLYVNVFRLRAENNNKSVEVLIDYNELAALSTANDISLDVLAARFKEAGATGVMMRERTLEELEETGNIVIMKGGEVSLLQQTNANFFPAVKAIEQQSYIFTKSESVYETIKNELEISHKDTTNSKEGETYLICTSLTKREIEKMGIGFLLADLEAVHTGGFSIVPRLREGSRGTEEEINYLAEMLHAIPGLAIVAFNDPAIPGANNAPYLAQKLKDLDVPVGTFEFFPQAGLTTLAKLLDKNVVRIHSISENDMTRYNETLAIERFNLAVSERNIRALYVRFFGMDQPAFALERALNFISSVRENMEREGFIVGKTTPLESIPYSRLIVFIIGLGVIGGGIIILNSLLPVRWTLLLALAGLLGWAGILYLDPLFARKAFALLSVIVFPVIGVAYLLREKNRSMKEAVIALILMSAVSFIGAGLMTGLLADKSFMLTLDIFSGVKLAHIVPLLIIPAYFILKNTDPAARVKELLNYPVLNKHVAIGIIVAAALVIYIIRTGNEATQLVSSWETALRSLLDQILGVRPRTKEFLLGHPAMLVLLYYGYDLRKIGLLLFGIIGQVSLVNTYAHIHTPLIISLIRSIHGLWTGILLGIVIIIAFNTCLKWYKWRFPDE